jgi:RNA polymerase sigma-70 factor (ECF subfamily)
MTGVPDDKRGARVVAGEFAGRAQGAQLALVDGVAGLMWAPRGKPRAIFLFQVADSRIVQITLLADQERIAELDLVALAG